MAAQVIDMLSLCCIEISSLVEVGYLGLPFDYARLHQLIA